MQEKLELRLYGLVPYNLSPIQQGIQFGHAVVEYGLQHGMTELYLDWAQNNKTFIILNGGTTNDNPKWLGTLNQHAQTLGEMNIPTSCFYEPDLGDQLTAVVFIVDERVFNKEKYPDPALWLQPGQHRKPPVLFNDHHLPESETHNDEENEKILQNFIQSIGGYTNYKLREFLKQFRLA